jgi:hypothetical protein
MTTDERLDRLVERHEALAHGVELLTKNMESMRSYVGEIAEGTARLLHIAQIHSRSSYHLPVA